MLGLRYRRATSYRINCSVKHKARPPEFTKRIVGAVMATYFWGVILGSYVVLRIFAEYPEYAVEALAALFTYIGAPTAVAIGFYAWKARAENQIKLKQIYGKLADSSNTD